MRILKKINYLDKSISKLNHILEEKKLYDVFELLDNKKKIFTRNLIAGMSKGLGIGIGFYIITAIVIYALQYIVRLNIPIIGDYISDLIDIVELNRK